MPLYQQTEPITVIIADDHELFRDGLAALLKRTPGISLLAEAANGKQLLDATRKLLPDVIITDLRMPVMEGIEALKRIHGENKQVCSIALSTFENDYLTVEALEAGAIGYIVKNAKRGEIIEAVKSVYQHHPYYCSSTSAKMVRLLANSRFNPYSPIPTDLFSDLEKKIIHHICEEKTNAEIGGLLFVAKRTIEGYRAQILEKMNVKSTAGLAIYAIKNGLYVIKE